MPSGVHTFLKAWKRLPYWELELRTGRIFGPIFTGGLYWAGFRALRRNRRCYMEFRV